MANTTTKYGKANTTTKLSTVDTASSSDISSANMLCVSNEHVKQLPNYIQQIDKNKNDIASMMLKIYPVGAIYISASATNPGTLFGGTWEQIKGRFLVAVGALEGNNNTWFGTVKAGSETSGRQANWYFNYAPGAAQAYFKTGFSGGSAAHNNMPPYLAVYMWKRTT